MSIKVIDNNNNLKAVQDVFVGNQRIYEVITQNQLKYYYGGKYKNLTDFDSRTDYLNAQPFQPYGNIGLTKNTLWFYENGSKNISSTVYSTVLNMQCYFNIYSLPANSQITVYNRDFFNKEQLQLTISSNGKSFIIFNLLNLQTLINVNNKAGFSSIVVWIFPYGSSTKIMVEWYAPSSITPNFTETITDNVDYIGNLNGATFYDGNIHDNYVIGYIGTVQK